VADRQWLAPFEDTDALREFAKTVDVVTLEFENIPADSLRELERQVAVRPGPNVLETSQHRRREKTALADAGFPVADFVCVTSLEELQRVAPGRLPAVLKSTAWGYDGKGQVRLDAAEQIDPAWHTLACEEAILEALIDFECELSVIAARSESGEVVSYEPVHNVHANHILDVSVSPSGLPPAVCEEAQQLARSILEQLQVVGVMCVEMFLTRNGELLVNELAPRPHNSGHLTIEAHVTSQFEQQVRAVCGLPLGSTRQRSAAAMANLLGDLWHPVPPDFVRVLQRPATYLHLYGKGEPKPGRKMGHITALAEDGPTAMTRVRDARTELGAAAAGPPRAMLHETTGRELA
ncbi:MAG: 5-(carboxyamino)imidazole ribonucleotide synthase, partial [Planctomycetota bacterium]